MRKLIIVSIAVIAVGLAFLIFVSLMDSTPLNDTNPDQTPDIDVSGSDSKPQKIGDVVPDEVTGAKYYKYDPVTKEPVAEYGFERMLNPGQGRSRWEVEKPYIVFYQSDYKCRLDSDKGIFQVDTSGSTGVPKEAQLDKNVKIHIMPTAGSPVGEMFIYMDDLIFSSERSELTTDGPVRIDSPQIQMDGYGLIFIFNTAIRRIEYLQLRDLEYLKLKEVASAQNTSSSDTAKDKPKATDSQEPKTEKSESKTDFYLCTIEDNVEIQYGNELIVSGADQVNIQNINFSDMEDKAPDSDSPKPTSSTIAEASSDTTQKEELKEVVVKCDGGIIVQPMPTNTTAEMPGTEPDLALEMSGAPLRIDRIVSVIPTESQALARCGLLTYRPAEDVLRMFTSPLQPQILLNAEDSNSRIQTSGNVFWDRKAQHANIAGPGKITIGNTKGASAEPSEINFQGVMDLLFAQMPQDVSGPSIQVINLTGGMDAILRENGTYKTKSNSAVLRFGQENQLAQAKLTGDVYLESMDAEKPAQAASQSAIFHFNDNQIAKADLAGNVRFASNEGKFASTNAVIEFQPDAGGSVQPTVLRTAGQAVMEAASTTAQPPAKFEAQKIDYDLETGSGLAYGPIRVTYYEAADPDSGSLDDWVPMTITADDDAQFYADQSRAIRKVEMKNNVIASRLTRTADFTQRDQVHGDKLVVNFDKDADGETAVSDAAVTEGKVFVQSTKVHDEEILFNVKLNCQRIDYNGLNEEIVAAGPGKIELDNSKVKPSEKEGEGVKFDRPCFALIDGFDTLKWNMLDQTIIADSQDETMQLAYIPLEDGLEEKYIYVNSRQIQAGFLSNSDGGLELKNIFTDKGIIFTEKDRFNKKVTSLFAGQTLKYDVYSDIGWLTITGTDANPCFVNGVRVPKIRYNINTGQLDAAISTTPGIISN
ncbi:MAG: hypothetical protein ACYSUT_01135 [Planctomycetota bacterium]|jgi:hypothetical protein